MVVRLNRVITLIGIVLGLTACQGDWSGSRPASTPTVVLVHYATPTVTPRPPITAAEKLPELAPPTPEIHLTSRAEAEDDQTDGSPPATRTPLATSPPTATPTPGSTSTQPEIAPPAETAAPTPIPTPAALSGRIAFPVDDGGGYYDVWVIELPPQAPPFLVQPRARQPAFAPDGRLLVKSQGSDRGESIGLLDAGYIWQGIINESPADSYPFWHPDGTRYAFSNSNLVKDPDTAHLAPYIFTACSLQIPRFEQDIKCQDTRQWGSITVGDAPVWTDDDRIVFFTYKGEDGLYFVEHASVLREAGGLGPPQLLARSNGRPTDTAGSRVFFSAGDIEGNWEAYAIDLDGSNLTNLSQSPLSRDGLPTISPDGDRVAFVSDRDGAWGIWVRPLAGGEARKVVDFSDINTNPSPWGSDDRAWMMERISWGP